MGSVFGRVSEETPAFAVVARRGTYEVRDYAANFAIETEKDGFMKLVGYIGVVKAPENGRREEMAMTAPVVSLPRGGGGGGDDAKERMQFILPSAVAAPPRPTDASVVVVQRPAMRMAVATWLGQWDDAAMARRRSDLVDAATADGFKVDAAHWEWHRFNPPWTLPMYKRNEVCVLVTASPTDLASLQSDATPPT